MHFPHLPPPLSPRFHSAVSLGQAYISKQNKAGNCPSATPPAPRFVQGEHRRNWARDVTSALYLTLSEVAFYGDRFVLTALIGQGPRPSAPYIFFSSRLLSLSGVTLRFHSARLVFRNKEKRETVLLKSFQRLPSPQENINEIGPGT